MFLSDGGHGLVSDLAIGLRVVFKRQVTDLPFLEDVGEDFRRLAAQHIQPASELLEPIVKIVQ